MFITNFFEDLSKDFSQLLESDDYDIIIHSGDKSNFKEFKVHSNIIRARSPYFKTALSNSNNWINDTNGFIIFKKPNISPAIFLLILRYIYTGVLDLTNQSGFDVLALLITFEELILDKLVDHIQMHLIKNESSWLQNNYVIVLHTVFKFKEFPILDKDIFLTLIKKDDMDIEEIDIWKYLIKWGTTQSISYKGKSKDANVNNWDENDFALFKKPYKKVLPENLYEDLMAYFMVNLSCKISKLPSRRSIDIDSVIIKGDKAKHITNWIEKRITFSRKPFYKFTLTYRATCDGFDYNKFIINNCDRAILVLVKVSDSGKIIGGYHPLGLVNYQQNESFYCNTQWEWTNDGFIFCYEDEKDSDTHILSRVKKPSRAIFNDKGSWMNFGNGDLILNGKNGTCRQCNYEEKILNTNKFVINELETFTVRKITD
ncbi:hypothetical protein C2G38_2250115 [Gigaspora rosea]|uniref:Uncharacterized protein n=1 Tax=Gigaspora rosea TaxID=44941 RepID=A0A397UQB7_9GLOM|nr:hypothetical protein C2G38_2250115 [Gigaspora rosea]